MKRAWVECNPQGKAQRSWEHTCWVERKVPSLHQSSSPDTVKLWVVLVSLPVPTLLLPRPRSHSQAPTATDCTEAARGRKWEPRGGATCRVREARWAGPPPGAPGGGGRCRVTRPPNGRSLDAIRLRAASGPQSSSEPRTLYGLVQRAPTPPLQPGPAGRAAEHGERRLSGAWEGRCPAYPGLCRTAPQYRALAPPDPGEMAALRGGSNPTQARGKLGLFWCRVGGGRTELDEGDPGEEWQPGTEEEGAPQAPELQSQLLEGLQGVNTSRFLLASRMTGLSFSLQGSCRYKSAPKAGVCKYINQSARGFALAFNPLRSAPAGDTSPRQSALLRRKLCAGPEPSYSWGGRKRTFTRFVSGP